ncbi:MAG: aminoglycoside phosphotransferase family protein, partial [Pseudonocardia sp.]
PRCPRCPRHPAVAAATAAGRDLGLTVTARLVLYDVFSVIVHLAPSQFVEQIRMPINSPTVASR